MLTNFPMKEIIQVYKLQKLDIHLTSELKDFAYFLGQKSLGSKIYLSINMLDNTLEFQQQQGKSSQSSKDQPCMTHLNHLLHTVKSSTQI